MIVAERKPFDEILEKVNGFKKILVLGCGTCVSVCMAGGEREVALLAAELRLAFKLKGKDIEISEATIQRQCDEEYIEPIIRNSEEYDAILSLGCGAGVQLVAQFLEPMVVLPGLNTKFLGITEAEGVWAERCLACGDCLLAEYGSICPVTRCTKGLLNGPCGGSKMGKCEAGDDRDCAWELIYDRLKQQGKLDDLRKLFLVKDNKKKDHPMRQVNDDYVKPEVASSISP